MEFDFSNLPVMHLMCFCIRCVSVMIMMIIVIEIPSIY